MENPGFLKLRNLFDNKGSMKPAPFAQYEKSDAFFKQCTR
jgi:hypothetical protein